MSPEKSVANAADKQQLSTMTDIEAKGMQDLQAPISRVPLDILLAIFILIRDATMKHPADRDASTSMYCYNPRFWLNFTQVCHTWREVAVNAPILWSRITASRQYHELTLEMLRRSKQCPLSLGIDLGLNVNPWRLVFQSTSFLPLSTIINDLKHHMGRCRALCLRGLTQPAFRELFTHCTSQLEYIVCDSSRVHLLLNDAVLLPANSLRRLELKNCILDWDAHFLNHLTYLKLDEIPNNNKLSRINFIEFLLRMRALEELHVEGSFLRDVNEDGDLSATELKTELKQLKYLCFICPIQEITYFLHAVTLPRFCKIRLGRLMDLDGTAPIYHLLRWVTTHFPPHELAGENGEVLYFRSFCINRHGTELTLHGFYDVLSHATMHTMCYNETAMFELSLQWDDTVHLILGELLPLFPLSRIICFGLYGDDDSARFILSSQIWSALRSVTTLKSVYIDAFYLDFFTSLVLDSFPALSSVALPRASSDDLQHILDFLRWRTAPLQELLLPSGCIVPPHIPPRAVSHIGYLHK